MQNVQTETEGNPTASPKLYKGTARGEVWTEFRENKQAELRQKRSSQRVDKVDTLIRQTKMNADEEARSRQYKSTAMSDDEVSKVYKIMPFGFIAKRYINENAHY